MNMTGVSGNHLTPEWELTPNTECGGVTNLIDATEVTIEHTQA